MASLYINRQETQTEIKKNYPIFHIRLLRDKQALAPLRGNEAPLSDAPEHADETPLLWLLAFLPISLFRLPSFMLGNSGLSGSIGAL